MSAFIEALVWWGREGPVGITADRRGDRLTVTASRTAVDEVDLDALFLARQPGTGGGSKIGLYVARRVAEASGGRAWGERSGDRLAFHVEVPASGPESDTQ